MRRLLAAVLVVGGCALLAFLLLRPVADSQQTARAQERLAEQLPGGPAPAAPVREARGRAGRRFGRRRARLC